MSCANSTVVITVFGKGLSKRLRNSCFIDFQVFINLVSLPRSIFLSRLLILCLFSQLILSCVHTKWELKFEVMDAVVVRKFCPSHLR